MPKTTPAAVSTRRCTGNCCQEFVLWSGKDKIHQTWITTWLQNHKQGIITLSEETQQVFKMVIPLADSEDNQYTPFTCQNFDKESGNCQIYESRPKMCRSFPGTDGCNFEECTLQL